MMDRGREAIVQQGMSHFYTGLGILLGTGKISLSTHSQVLALVSSDQGIDTATAPLVDTTQHKPALVAPTSRPGKETPVSLQSNDLGTDLGNLSLSEKFGRGPSALATKASVPPSPAPHERDSWRSGVASPPRAPPQAMREREETLANNEVKIVCPWWSTPGSKCRYSQTGDCPFFHEDIPNGIRDPLICPFWADGGRCTKAEDVCKFCHYPSQHRQIAPLPGQKNKNKQKNKANNPPPDDGWY